MQVSSIVASFGVGQAEHWVWFKSREPAIRQ
jgi:hypothetical protein